MVQCKDCGAGHGRLLRDLPIVRQHRTGRLGMWLGWGVDVVRWRLREREDIYHTVSGFYYGGDADCGQPPTLLPRTGRV